MRGSTDKKIQFGRFDIKQYVKRDSYNQYRLYFFLGGLLSPVFTFIVFNNNQNHQNLIIDLSIPFIFIGIAMYSFYSEKLSKNLKYVFFGICVLLTLYAYLIFARSGYTSNNFLAFLVAYLAILIGINDHRLSVIYFIYYLAIFAIVRFFIPAHLHPVGSGVEMTMMGIIALVGFLIHYNSHKSLKTILYNEGFLNNILNTTADGIILLDENGIILDVNKKAENIFKWQGKKEITGKHYGDLLMNKNEKIHIGKTQLKKSDGTSLTSEININKAEYGGYHYQIVLITDVTDSILRSRELEMVKSQLVESEKTYRELFDNSYDLLFIVNGSLIIIDTNKRVMNQTSHNDDYFHNKKITEFIPENEVADFESWIKNSNNKFIPEKSFSLLGEKYDLNFRRTDYYDKEHFVIAARPAAARLKYESILKESRDRMTMILENINSIIYYQEVDVHGETRIRYLSPKIEDVIGISVDEFLTLTKAGKVNDLIHPEDFNLVSEKRKQVIREKVSVEFMYRVRKNNEFIWLEERIYPKFDENGNHVANFGVSTDVSAAQKSKSDLESSNRRNRDFIARNLAGFYRLDTDKNILDCNDSFAKIFGYGSAGEIIGKNVNEIYKDSSDRNSFIQNLREKKSIINNESMITLKNNRVIWILENASLITDADDNEVIESTVFDITDLKKTELALEKSEETLSMILTNIEDLIYNVEFNDDGTRFFNYLGNQVERITGLTKEEYMERVNNKTIHEFIHPDDLNELYSKTEELKLKKNNQDFTYRFKLKNGNYIWIEESVFPQFDKDGKLKRLFGVVREISEKKEYEEALIHSEERYRTLFEKNLAGVFRTTINGKFLECNDAFVKIFGFQSKEELFSKSIGDLYFTKEDRENYLKELRKKGALFNYELSHKRKDGTKIWVLANVAMVNNRNNEPEIIQGTLVDITELKKTSEALTDSEEKFRLLFEATNDAIFILESDRIVDCNEKSLETFSCSIEEKNKDIGKGVRLYEMSPKFQPDGIPSYEKLAIKIKEVLAGHSQMFYWRFIRKDGILFDAEVSLNSFHLNDKNFIQAIIRDITARMKAEVALRESEERFKMLSNATIEGIIFTDNGMIVDSNEQFAFLYGFKSRNQVIGRNIDEFLYDNDDIQKVRKIITEQSEEKFEVKSKRQDGKLIWVESKGRMIPYHGKRLRVSVVYDITVRKLKEQELQESRESFMSLTELSPNGSIIHIDGVIQYANPSVMRFLGYNDMSELKGKNLLDFLTVDQHEKSLDRIKRIKKGENIGFAEFVINNKKGQHFEIGVQSVRIVYNGTEAIHVIISDLSQQKQLQKEKLRAQLAEETNLLLAKEIQERKDAEQRLWETQMFTTNMFNSSMDMIMASDRNNLITQVNNSVLKIFGYKTEEIIGLHPAKLYASEADFEVVRMALLEKGTFSGEIKNVDKNGHVFISYLSASVLRNTQGKIIGTMGISRDITETLKAQKKIQEQNAQIRSIFDNASNMLIWTIDRNYCLVSYNNNFTDIITNHFHIIPKKGMSIVDIIRPRLSDELFDYSIKSFEKTFNGENSELEGPFKTENGNTIWIETFLNPIFFEDGSINEISCISHEITEKKAIESQIRQSLKEKEVLLKEVHHRVKNNLQVISSILNLQSSYVKDEQTLNILRESQNRIKSMSYIHESLYQTKNFSSINFSEYIVNLSNNLFHSYQIFDNFIELKLEVDPVNLNLDQAIPCGLIVNELITNSLKYAFKGKTEGMIFIGISEKGKAITIRIEDNGLGLPKGFNYRKTETLGLQLVVTLVEQLDGKLELKSEKGTKYLITFDKLN